MRNARAGLARVSACVISLALLLPLLVVISPAASSEQTVTRTPPYDFGCVEGSLGLGCTLVGTSVPCVGITYSLPPLPHLSCRLDVSPQHAGIYVDVTEDSYVTLSAEIKNEGLVQSQDNMEACFGVKTPGGSYTYFSTEWCTQLPPIGELATMTTDVKGSFGGHLDPGRWGFSVHLRETNGPWLGVSGPNPVSVESISVRLTSVDGSGSEPASDTTAPTQPTGLTAQALNGKRVSLEWNPSTDSGSGLESYRIERSGEGSSFTEIAMTTETSYTDKGLERNTTYTYRVIACDKAGNCSPPSDTATAQAK
jgi:hypothetical protein